MIFVFNRSHFPLQVTVLVTTQIEIDCKHHTFIIGRNGSNIKHIMQSTGARYVT